MNLVMFGTSIHKSVDDAIRKGRIMKRLKNKAIGRIAGRMMK